MAPRLERKVGQRFGPNLNYLRIRAGISRRIKPKVARLKGKREGTTSPTVKVLLSSSRTNGTELT